VDPLTALFTTNDFRIVWDCIAAWTLPIGFVPTILAENIHVSGSCTEYNRRIEFTTFSTFGAAKRLRKGSLAVWWVLLPLSQRVSFAIDSFREGG
tara:strand:- start:213 stop:497 length:285 start_codon:yes stop_codon:yes gene_type:complete